MVDPVQVLRVTEVTMFVRAICRSQPGATQGLADILTLLYTLIHRWVIVFRQYRSRVKKHTTLTDHFTQVGYSLRAIQLEEKKTYKYF